VPAQNQGVIRRNAGFKVLPIRHINNRRNLNRAPRKRTKGQATTKGSIPAAASIGLQHSTRKTRIRQQASEKPFGVGFFVGKKKKKKPLEECLVIKELPHLPKKRSSSGKKSQDAEPRARER